MTGKAVSCVLAIKVQPRAKANKVRGRMADGHIKISLTAPPADGKANLALIDFLSEQLGVSKGELQIKTGFTARKKLISVEGIDEKTALRLLAIEEQ